MSLIMFLAGLNVLLGRQAGWLVMSDQVCKVVVVVLLWLGGLLGMWQLLGINGAE